jgi:malate synthase
MTAQQPQVEGVEVRGPMENGAEQILTPEALQFIATLQREFIGTRKQLLQRRAERQAEIDNGQLPDFLPETEHIRQRDWHVAPIPAALQDRRVEITGPSGDRKMVINALNSGASVFMVDFEDAQSPTWDGLLAGQMNLRDAIRREIDFTSPEGKQYKLNEKTAVLMARPRGWHL